MRRRYSVNAEEELLHICGGVTPYMRRSYSIYAEELLHSFCGASPLAYMRVGVLRTDGVTPPHGRSYSIRMRTE